jgi:hypothetical protein
MRRAPHMDNAVKGYTHVDWLLLWSGDSTSLQLCEDLAGDPLREETTCNGPRVLAPMPWRLTLLDSTGHYHYQAFWASRGLVIQTSV